MCTSHILLSSAHTAGVIDSPVITANSLEGIEEVVRIILLLDLQQGAVVAAEEGILPVGLTEVGLVLVASTAGSDGLKLRDKLIGDAILVGDHVSPGSLFVPGCADLHGDGSVTEGGENGVVDITRVGDIEADTNGNHAVFGDVADGGGDAGWVGVECGTGDEAASVLVLADAEVAVWQRTHVLVVVVVVGGVLGVGDGVGDVKAIKDIEERCQECLHISTGLVVGSNRVESEEGRGNLVDDRGTRIDHGGQQGMELSDGLVEVVGSGGAGQELETGTANGGIRVGLDGSVDDNTVVTGTTTANGPEEIGVGRAVGSEKLAIGSDNLILESIIGSQAKSGTESRVTATLDIASGKTDGGTFTANDNQTLGVSSLHDLEAHDTSAYFESRTRVVSVRPGLVRDAIEVVHPDGKGTSTSGTSKVIMAGVTDDETDVVLLGKVDSSNDIVGRRDIDGVVNVVAHQTRAGLGREGVTAVIGKVGLHDGGR